MSFDQNKSTLRFHIYFTYYICKFQLEHDNTYESIYSLVCCRSVSSTYHIYSNKRLKGGVTI